MRIAIDIGKDASPVDVGACHNGRESGSEVRQSAWNQVIAKSDTDIERAIKIELPGAQRHPANRDIPLLSRVTVDADPDEAISTGGSGGIELAPRRVLI